MVNKRNSSIEILRISAMFMIVLSHFVTHTNWNGSTINFSFNSIIINSLKLGNFGNTIFVLISSYFIIGNKFKPSKVFKIWGDVFLYSIIGYLLFVFFKKNTLSTKEIISIFFPLIFNKYWFASTYIIFYLVTPLLNVLLNHLSKKQHLYLLLLGFVLWPILNTITNQGLQYSSLLYFIYLFFIAGYIKMYINVFKISSKASLTFGICSLILYFISVVCLLMLGKQFTIFQKKTTMFGTLYSPIVLMASVLLFIGAIKCNPFESRLINKFSACTFGVYLITEHPLVRNYIWNELLPSQLHFDSGVLLPYCLISVIIVYLVCIIIEYIRLNTIDRFWMKLYKKIDTKLPDIN